MYEGLLNADRSLQGPVTFYYKSGQIKRIAIYELEDIKYDNGTFGWTDIPHEVGEWKYYKKSGRLYKQKEFLTFYKVNNEKKKYFRISILYSVDKKGIMTEKKTELINTYTE